MPQAIIIGGPNGSGKSTFAEEYLVDHPVDYLCTDAIAVRLDPEKPDRSKVKAGRAFIKTVREYIDEGRDLMIESTLSGKTLRHLINKLKRHDYVVTIIYLFLENTDICVHRVQQRVLKGGHHVPAEDVIRRFHRSKINFWVWYRKMADRWYIYYNSEDNFEVVAASIGGEYHLVNDELFEKFRKVVRSVGPETKIR